MTFGITPLLTAAGLALSLLVQCLSPAGAQSGAPPVIAAASDLQFALPEVAEAFQKETGHAVRLSFGSSGNFTRQLRQGAPYQLFFSADEDYVDGLARDGFLRDAGVLYAVGRIVLFVPNGSPLQADAGLADLEAALTDGRLKKFAIANPEHAPYGRRAEEALRHRGLWDRLKDRLVLGETVSQAVQFATTANVQGGIIAYSLALSPKVSAQGRFELIADSWHRPIRQRMALSKSASPVAEMFYAFAQAATARAIFRQHGFVLPGEGT